MLIMYQYSARCRDWLSEYSLKSMRILTDLRAPMTRREDALSSVILIWGSLEELIICEDAFRAPSMLAFESITNETAVMSQVLRDGWICNLAST